MEPDRQNERIQLLSLNLKILFAGAVLTTGGVYVTGFFYDYNPLVNQTYIAFSYALVIVGGAILCTAFFGSYGAIKRRILFNKIHFISLVLIFFLELIIIIIGSILHSKTERYLTGKLESSMDLYDNDSKYADAWDYLQRQYSCCGIRNSTDWIIYTNATESSIPSSCCYYQARDKDTFACAIGDDNIFKIGCLDLFIDATHSHLLLIIIIIVGLTILQVVYIITFYYVFRSIRADYERIQD